MIPFINKKQRKEDLKENLEKRYGIKKVVRDWIFWGQSQASLKLLKPHKLPVVLGIKEINGRIYSVAVTDVSGFILADTLINPALQLPDVAYEKICISRDELDAAPLWHEYSQTLIDLLKGREGIIYDSPFITDLLVNNEQQTEKLKGCKRPEETEAALKNYSSKRHIFYLMLNFTVNDDKSILCAAKKHKEFQESLKVKTVSNKFEQIEHAAKQYGVSAAQIGRGAVKNCRLTLRILEHISAD